MLALCALNIPIFQNGVLSALPYLLMSVFSVSSGWISDLIINRLNISKAMARKTFQLLGHGGAVIGLVMLSFVGCDRTLAIVALCIGVGLKGLASAGFLVCV